MKSLIIAACRALANVVTDPHRFAPMLYQTTLAYTDRPHVTVTWWQFRDRVRGV
jgi:hypothetical protein